MPNTRIEPSNADWSVGIDTGGTFTDLAAVQHGTGRRFVAKVSSTPANPADAILEALARFSKGTDTPLSRLRMLAHGTTVATNALLEGKGAKAGLLITRGFRAIYPARSGTRPRGADLINPGYRKPELLIPLGLTFEVSERIGHDGAVVDALDENEVRHAARQLRERGVESVAVCFLFSFLNPAHEQAAARILQQELPDCRISLSSEVLPVIREYPRLATVAVDAYVGPVVRRYFEDLAARAADLGVRREQFFIMQSYGGLMRIDVAARYPNETLLSGPAAGIAFARAMGARIGARNIVTFDMGGTSTDISLVIDGAVEMARGGQIAGHDIGTPMIQIETLGAGGGAIASLSADGLLKVGPRSAGARPGPACYGLGGTEPTVTDANVVLGYVDPTRLAGGGVSGQPALAHEALQRLGQQLGMDAVQAAVGVRRVVNAYMLGGVRMHITHRGGDPREFSLFAFGGAGPLHAAEIAQELEVAQVVIPPHPGISCAAGLLLSDIKHLYLRSFPAPLHEARPEALEAAYAQLAERAWQDGRIEGFGPDQLVLERQVDLRYRHQGYDLTLPVPPQLRSAADLRVLREAFDTTHRQTYGVAAPDEEVAMVTLRLQSVARVQQMPLPELPPAAAGKPTPGGYRQAYFEAADGFVNTPVYQRSDLGRGAVVDGPAIVEQLDSTSVIGPQQRLVVDAVGNLVVQRSSAST
jgi:N-methylhydantoinase A